MTRHAEHWKEPEIAREISTIVEIGAIPQGQLTDDGTADDLRYVAKLKHSGRPRTLTGAVLLLLLAMRRLSAGETNLLRVRVALWPFTYRVGAEIAQYIGQRTGIAVDPDPVTKSLGDRIASYAALAAASLSGDALLARRGLIVQSEVQQATAHAVQQIATSLESITRNTTSDAPCATCASLAGTYIPPIPPIFRTAIPAVPARGHKERPMALTAAQREAIPQSDFAWPDAPGGQPKYPITSQARLDAAARLIGRAPRSVQARIRARAIAIAKRKGYTLPDSWQ